MNPANREHLLKIGVGVVVGLFLLNWLVWEPLSAHWTEQGKRMEELRQQVRRGRELIAHESATRDRWAEMQRTDLPPEADNDVFRGVNRWVRDSRVALTSLTPAWRTHDEGYQTLDCRATATGDQAALGKFLYDLETDALPARLEECEFSTRDKTGKQLTLSLRFSFVRLAAAASNNNPR